NFVGTGSTLILGSSGANRTVTLTNALNLGGANRTIEVVRGTSSTVASGALSGVISNGSLTVTGNGRLDATAANTLAGTVTVTGAELRLGGNGTMTSVSGFSVKEGGALVLDNAGTNNTNRVGNSAGVGLSGGTLGFLGNSGANS